MFNVIVYTMTSQPMELPRFLWFSTCTTVLALVSEGLGVLIGVIFNCTVSICLTINCLLFNILLYFSSRLYSMSLSIQLLSKYSHNKKLVSFHFLNIKCFPEWRSSWAISDGTYFDVVIHRNGLWSKNLTISSDPDEVQFPATVTGQHHNLSVLPRPSEHGVCQ